ncbi:condensin subunit ScpA [Rhodothalassium salexigens DSM 2132]|uniref:Segregation and condensation protein A n=1 Tax=Rhodothalassium salexigens DSM 2132 TaxID=1188247 RepID=A0A4R2PRX5_RHOSA|nr:ScpA family protein [Rhodothalassium salexigens]MBB4210343.1 segregation and condensation protein A [Rhodothalassium salexigens DSM 2132]MBK1638884.1 hypothetical protein [Rhodothalassium salexigens DSM 2132]TCP38507.1 condensin subunit ScpA [Rhodothalassium salexigens DSM 2132]
MAGAGRDADWALADAASGAAGEGAGAALVVDLDGFEGPLDLLLVLARRQKVDLARLSIRDLAEQYLAFVTEARRLNLELAADYLVMAAWLAYLKSRLLLPPDADDEEPSAEDLALRLQLRLQRLEAMREAGARLLARDRLGRDVLARGAPEGVVTVAKARYQVSLYDLLRAYAQIDRRRTARHMHIARRPVYTLDEALARLSSLLGQALDWTLLKDFLPPEHASGPIRQSAVASLFAASLELAKQGRVGLHQGQVFGPLYLKAGRPGAGPDTGEPDTGEPDTGEPAGPPPPAEPPSRT